jgi:hypothetical protein
VDFKQYSTELILIQLSVVVNQQRGHGDPLRMAFLGNLPVSKIEAQRPASTIVVIQV